MSGWLDGKRCLIVGGTSGLGLAAARRFLEEGARLVVAGKEDARAVAAHVVLCDVTLSDEVDALFADSVSYLGGLDVLYHVAGGSGRRSAAGARRSASPTCPA